MSTAQLSATAVVLMRAEGDVTNVADVLPARDEATMLKVMESSVKLVSRRAAGALEKRWQKCSSG
jgi:hypothetical protein